MKLLVNALMAKHKLVLYRKVSAKELKRYVQITLGKVVILKITVPNMK